MGTLWQRPKQRWPGLTGSPCWYRLTHYSSHPCLQSVCTGGLISLIHLVHLYCFPRLTHFSHLPNTPPPPQEIQRHEPDVICLEEVCCTFYTSIPPSICARSFWTSNNPWLLPRWSSFPQVDCFSQLSSQLDGAGFGGVWVPKPSSPCLKFKVDILVLIIFAAHNDITTTRIT